MSDAEARERAAHRFDENLVVVAGAGSGKTSLLVERVLCQMVGRGLGSDELVAITFTEKAAAEMRRRLESGLARLAAHARADTPAAALDPGREADRAFAWLRERAAPAAIERLARERLRALPETEITTIHGFCARLLRRFPLEAGVDPEFDVDTGGRSAELVDELWERFLAGPDGLEGPRAERFARVLERLWLGELAGLARRVATFALPEDALDVERPDARAVFGAWASAQLAAIDRLLQPPPARGPESWLDAARPLLAALRDSGIDAFQAGLAAARYARTKGLCDMLDGSPPTSTSAPAATELVKALFARFKSLRAVDDALLSEAVALLRPFAREVRAEALRRGILPFDALLALTRDLLARHPRVRRELARRYRVLFLDEFQDTDPLQYAIVFLLAAESDAEPIPPGKLFIVGDPKQAIYRFRGADIGAYERAVAQVLDQGGVRLTLTANFRSRPEILDPLDRLFRRTFADPAPGESVPGAWVEYDGLSASRAPAGEPRLELWRIGQAASAEQARNVEAEAIAGWIARGASEGRLRFREVALLFRALTDSHVYVRALQQRHVAVWIGRAEDPEKEPAAQQLMALLRALANPADAPAVLGVLRSPLGGVPDAELARHAALDGKWLYTAAVRPDPTRVPELARAFALLARWHERVRTEPLADVLGALRDETAMLALHASARDGQRRDLDLSALLDRLVARAAAGPERGLPELVATLEGEEQRRAAEEPLPDTDAVRVLSIHAAKGLEFETVILPDLARGVPQELGDARGIDVRFSREQDALALRTRAAVSATWVEHERHRKVHADAEMRRLLYVAATRARERLVFAQAERTRGANSDTFAALLGDWEDPQLVRLAIPAADPALAPLAARTGASPLAALDRTRRVAELARASTRAPLARPSGLHEADEEHASASSADPDESLPPAASAARELARALGTALHEVLERWSFKSPAAARALLRGAVARAARLSAVSEPALAAQAEAALDALLDSGLPAALARVDVVGRELPLLFEDADGTRWNGTIDLLYRDPGDGRLVVADYKSDAKPDRADRARYMRQLAVYARGVARLFPGELPPAAELIWLRSGQRERLPLESPA